MPLQLANAIGIAVGITMSFWLNRAFTFQVSDRAMARFATFWAVGLTGLVLSAIILEVGLRAGFEPMRVKLVSVVVVAATAVRAQPDHHLSPEHQRTRSFTPPQAHAPVYSPRTSADSAG